jgi:hypothetical protein
MNTVTEVQLAENYEDFTGFETMGFETYESREAAIRASMSVHPAGKRQLSESEISGKTVGLIEKAEVIAIRSGVEIRDRLATLLKDDRGDVPGWVLVVLMTTGLVTAIWAIAKPNLTGILNNSLNSMNSVK